jgi:hypothetical protein
MTTQLQPDSCPECAALVRDLDRHAAWHADVAPVGAAPAGGGRGRDGNEGPDPDQRIIGNMR